VRFLKAAGIDVVWEVYLESRKRSAGRRTSKILINPALSITGYKS
jgi:signal recognition particle subunit SEC65